MLHESGDPGSFICLPLHEAGVFLGRFLADLFAILPEDVAIHIDLGQGAVMDGDDLP